MKTLIAISEEDILNALYDVKDPEIPPLSIVDLGIVTRISLTDENAVSVGLTPTFSGCPALRMMEEMVHDRVSEIEGVTQVDVSTNFDVQWNSDMISEAGLKALKKHGLAPPAKHEGYLELDVLSDIPCPYCASRNTTMENPFGPTLCRSIHYCKNCSQAFEAFKPVL